MRINLTHFRSALKKVKARQTTAQDIEKFLNDFMVFIQAGVLPFEQAMVLGNLINRTRVLITFDLGFGLVFDQLYHMMETAQDPLKNCLIDLLYLLKTYNPLYTPQTNLLDESENGMSNPSILYMYEIDARNQSLNFVGETNPSEFIESNKADLTEIEIETIESSHDLNLVVRGFLDHALLLTTTKKEALC